MKKSAMQIVSTRVMSIMRHSMEGLKAVQMLFQQHGSKPQLKELELLSMWNFLPQQG